MEQRDGIPTGKRSALLEEIRRRQLGVRSIPDARNERYLNLRVLEYQL